MSQLTTSLLHRFRLLVHELDGFVKATDLFKVHFLKSESLVLKCGNNMPVFIT